MSSLDSSGMSVVSPWRPIKRIQHCSQRDLYCFSVPCICPLCGRDTATTQSVIPPFVIPSPITSARQSPVSVVIKPTRNSFMLGYNKECDLHIGVTSTQGIVYDYDEQGLHVGSSKWGECVSVSLTNQIAHIMHIWDKCLSDYCLQHDSENHRYSEEDYNCFDFVLSFFRYIDPDRCILNAGSKRDFTSSWIKPSMQKVEAYIAMYQEIEKTGYFSRYSHKQ